MDPRPRHRPARGRRLVLGRLTDADGARIGGRSARCSGPCSPSGGRRRRGTLKVQRESSTTMGFLSGVAVGPMESTFHDWAGATWADWLFMLGLLGIGLALTAGIGLRLAAVAGTAMMALMWIAEWPPAKHLSDGSASMSTNPFADYHLIYAVVLIALAAAGAGATWGLGRAWARLPFVSRNRWLL
ncbi:hypothetical protein [Streptomyces sp. A012304]|uniref:hypothetical protein n=1 Tax=Streptomyces sp. A012304 TaxID=375446 RepID=UPI0035D47985